MYLRLVWPFAYKEKPDAFVPGAGMLIRPGAEVRYTNLHEFWTVSRANSLGFVDREPIDPRRAAESCHIAMIGDSYVAALEVPIADKFHVRLEELAARDLPGLDVTTSAWGVQGTGTINQLPFYDLYARRLEPKILVLVVYANDFRDNVPLYDAYQGGKDPDRHPFATAVQAENGAMTLRPPSADSAEEMRRLAKRFRGQPHPWLRRFVQRAAAISGDYRFDLPGVRRWWTRTSPTPHPASFLARYALSRYPSLPASAPSPDQWLRQRELWMDILRRRPDYAWILPPRGSAEEGEWRHPSRLPTHLPRVRKYVSDFTAFGIDMFKERADRDGAALLILWVPYPWRHPSHWTAEALKAMARERGVPLIDLHEDIARRGRDVEESRLKIDRHWSATGHLWAAEALLEWLAGNRHACGAGRARGIDEPPAHG